MSKTGILTYEGISSEHRRYREARSMLGVASHYEFFKLIAAADAHSDSSHYVTSSQARADCKTMLASLERKEFEAKPYVMEYVDRILDEKLDLKTLRQMSGGTIVDFPPKLARSDKEHRKASASTPPIGRERFPPKVIENGRRLMTS